MTVTVRRTGMASHRPRDLLVWAALVPALLSASGCSGDEAQPSREAGQSTASSVPSRAESSAAESPAAYRPGRFDALTITLTLRSPTAEQGKTLRSRATVENNSTKVVVEPACVIGEGRYALVPADQPDAELWVRPKTDCGGPNRMPPGYHDEFGGPGFFARTKYGEPLPPGEYLAVLAIRGISQRLEYPVTVTR
jgi:hypothetical protein